VLNVRTKQQPATPSLPEEEKMGSFLSPEELAKTRPAADLRFASPTPTRMISNGEFTPMPQNELQKRFEARLKELAGGLAKKQGMSGRDFLRTAAGVTAAFVAMNEVFGPNFVVSSAEAADPAQAAERARRLASQFVFDDQVHFLREGSKLVNFIGLRKYTAGHLNLQAGDPGGMENLMFKNFVKELYLDSDTKIALVSSAPSAWRAAIARTGTWRRKQCFQPLLPEEEWLEAPGWSDFCLGFGFLRDSSPDGKSRRNAGEGTGGPGWLRASRGALRS
jgi:hypothetical protein